MIDEMELISRADPAEEVTSYGDERIGALVAQLTRPERGPQPRRPPHVRRRWLAMSVAAATFVAVCAAGVGLAPWNPRHGAPTAEAADILHNAADQLRQAPDIVLGSGQYRLIRKHTTTAAVLRNGSGDSPRVIGQLQRTDLIWVPSRYDSAWVYQLGREQLTGLMRGDTGSPRQLRNLEKEVRTERTGLLIRARGGNFPGDYALQFRTDGGGYGDLLRSLPSDPGDILSRVFWPEQPGATPDAQAWTDLTMLLDAAHLNTNAERARILEAMALVPGVSVVQRSVRFAGRDAVALSMTPPADPAIGYLERVEIMVDTGTGRVLGQRQVMLADYRGMPAGAVTYATDTSQEVVDSAPLRRAVSARSWEREHGGPATDSPTR